MSYNEKHNEANGEDNRDGESHNRSWNCGVEGPTDDPDILALRAKQMRNIIATLMLSPGHADDLATATRSAAPSAATTTSTARTPRSRGWTGRCAENNADLLTFTRKVDRNCASAHPVFRRRRFFEGKPIRTGEQIRDIAWLTPAGKEMTPEDWGSGFDKCVAVFLNGDAIPAPNERGERVVDDSFLLCFNAHGKAVDFVAPDNCLRRGVDRRARHRRPDRSEPAGGQGRRNDRRCRRGHCSCCVRRPDAWPSPVLSTYRLQMRGDCFTFADAEKLLDYLDDLGVSHLYLSPILTAAEGSTHGYDVTDPTTVSAELGGADGLARLSAAARARGMGLIVDIVPNHVGVDEPEQNPWWWDVLDARP